MAPKRDIQKFLVGVDGKGHADHAVHAAAMHARRFDARIDLVHAVPVPPALWIGIDEAMLAEMHQAALATAEVAVRERMERLEHEHNLAAGELTERLVVVPGDPGKELIHLAREGSPDFLVLGTHRDRSAYELGRTARAVLAGARCGIWLQPSPYRPIERVVAAIDLSAYDSVAMETARDLARRLEAKLAIVHCFQVPPIAYDGGEATVLGWPRYELAALRRNVRSEFDERVGAFDWNGAEVERIFLEGDATDELLKQLDPAQLLVMGTHGHSGLSGFLLGHVTWSVLKRAEAPVIAVRKPGRTWLM
jgi:nucleotide-binding universal stress UspA family protein